MEVRNRHLDNRGMTLVELLIAIIILAIITVPLLHAFISAASVNMNSRKRLRVTTTAQDVMEGLRADTLEELALQIYYSGGIVDAINGKVTRDGFRIIDKNLVKGSMSENRCIINADGSVSDFDRVYDYAANDDDKPCIVSSDAGVTYDFINKPGGKYYFYLQDVTVENTGSSNYFVDVLISVDATPYRSSGSMTVSPNSVPLVDITDMSDIKDVVFEINEKDMLNAINGVYSTSYELQDMVLDANIDINKNSVVGMPDEFVAKIYYKLYAKDEPTHYKDEISQLTRNELRNVYLFYQPTYNGKNLASNAEPDNITYNNNDLVDSTFYIVKQYDGTLPFIESWEENYRCNVSIVGETGADPHTKVRTNLDYSLKDIMLNAAAGHSGTYSKLATPQAKYRYKALPSDPGVEMTDAEREAIIDAVGGKAEKDRIYSVNVYVYEKDSIANAFSNGGEIPADKLLVTLDGTIR